MLDIPASYVYDNSIKLASDFLVTVSHTHVPKDHVFNSLEDFCDSLLVSEELHHFDGSKHHHIYMHTKVKYHIDDIIGFAQETYHTDPDLTLPSADEFKVYTARSVCKILKYITKEDQKPLFKALNEKEFSFNYGAIAWAENTPNFDYADPFVLGHPQYYRLLEHVHSSVKTKAFANRSFKFRLYPTALSLANSITQMSPASQIDVSSQVACFEDLNEWQLKVVGWWNDFVINGPYHKRKQLYLFGDPNTGKTTFIRNLLSLCVYEKSNPSKIKLDNVDIELESYTFRPTPNDFQFAFQSFDASIHLFTHIDEFDIAEFNVSDMKRFMAGEPFTSNVKQSKAKRILSELPMFMVSNNKPPNTDKSDKYKGIYERLYPVEATGLVVVADQVGNEGAF